MARLMVLAAATCLIAGAACNGLSSRSRDTRQPGLVEAPRDDTPAMTPAERQRRFSSLYAEGLELAEQQQYAYALRAFEQAVALEPTSTDALFNLGACYDATGDPLRAVGIYRRILKVRPDDSDCYANLGTAFIKVYYRDRSPIWRKMAREAWQHALKLNADQPKVKDFLAMTEAID
ncbi:MAG: tetratricopeptide repeat protein [Planctomycetota bacterium]